MNIFNLHDFYIYKYNGFVTLVSSWFEMKFLIFRSFNWRCYFSKAVIGATNADLIADITSVDGRYSVGTDAAPESPLPATMETCWCTEEGIGRDTDGVPGTASRSTITSSKGWVDRSTPTPGSSVYHLTGGGHSRYKTQASTQTGTQTIGPSEIHPGRWEVRLYQLIEKINYMKHDTKRYEPWYDEIWYRIL